MILFIKKAFIFIKFITTSSSAVAAKSISIIRDIINKGKQSIKWKRLLKLSFQL